jgi:hypothetical protein
LGFALGLARREGGGGGGGVVGLTRALLGVGAEQVGEAAAGLGRVRRRAKTGAAVAPPPPIPAGASETR